MFGLGHQIGNRKGLWFFLTTVWLLHVPVPLPTGVNETVENNNVYLGPLGKEDEKFFILFNGEDEIWDWLGFPKNSGL